MSLEIGCKLPISATAFSRPRDFLIDFRAKTDLSSQFQEFELVLTQSLVCSKTYSRFSHDVTATMFVPLNKEKAAMFVSRPNPPGIELYYHANVDHVSKYQQFKNSSKTSLLSGNG